MTIDLMDCLFEQKPTAMFYAHTDSAQRWFLNRIHIPALTNPIKEI